MHLVDDVDVFLVYSWGAVLYKFLVLETHGAKKRLSEKICNDVRLSVDAHGFMNVL